MEVFILLFFICAVAYHLVFAYDKKARFDVKVLGYNVFQDVSYKTMQRIVSSCKEEKLSYTVIPLKIKA